MEYKLSKMTVYSLPIAGKRNRKRKSDFREEQILVVVKYDEQLDLTIIYVILLFLSCLKTHILTPIFIPLFQLLILAFCQVLINEYVMLCYDTILY